LIRDGPGVSVSPENDDRPAWLIGYRPEPGVASRSKGPQPVLPGVRKEFPMTKVFWGLGLAILTCVTVAGFSTAGEEEQSVDMEAYMKHYLEVTAPNQHHQALAKRVGQWNTVIKYYLSPEAEPMVSTGTCTYELVMGGRFVEQRAEGEVLGIPFEGVGYLGFDKTTGKHTSFWIDSMGTQSIYAEGECSHGGMTETYMFTTHDPMTGDAMQIKTVTTIKSDNEHTYEWFEKGADGRLTKTMEVDYTRVGS
jgi:hypothetical protein